MRRWLIVGVLAVAGAGCSWLGASAPPEPSRGRLRPTCADVEQDACVAESVTFNARQLWLDEASYKSLDRRPVPVRCVLRETGVVEACHVLDSRGAELDARLVELLQPRRYEPVTYRGRPVLVPYTFLISFAPPGSEAAATAAIRLEVFRALLRRLPARRADGGVQAAQPLVCVGVGDDVADPPVGELEALRRGGASVEPASSCWGLMQAVGGAAPFGSVVVREVQLERPDVAQVRAEVGVSGQMPEFLSLRASRLADRWLIEEQPAAVAPDAGPGRPVQRVP
jgi:hypothetical protein